MLLQYPDHWNILDLSLGYVKKMDTSIDNGLVVFDSIIKINFVLTVFMS